METFTGLRMTQFSGLLKVDGVTTRAWMVDDDLWALIAPLLPPWPE